MDAIPLPFYEVVPLDDIAAGVKGLRILFVNVFALSTPSGGWTLIDTGLYLSAGKIKHWAENHFGKGTKPEAIVLTHGHFDHVGAVKDLLGDWNVPVYAHPDELPFLTGHAKYPPPDPGVGGGLMAVMSPLYPRTSADLSNRVQPLPADGAVPTLPNWRWIHTPGHAPGHISLYREEDKVLLPGDAFCTTKQESFLAVAKQKPELHGPPVLLHAGLGRSARFRAGARQALSAYHCALPRLADVRRRSSGPIAASSDELRSFRCARSRQVRT